MSLNKKDYPTLFIISFLFCQTTICCQQKSLDLQVLLSDAQKTQIHLTDFLKKCDKGALIYDPGIKSRETINQILSVRWNGDASKITDYSRATIAFDTINQVYNFIDVIRSSHEFEIVTIRDNFANPYPEGYRDINIVVKDLTNNHLGEIQINTKPIVMFKNKKGHKLFEAMRSIQAKMVQEKRSATFEELKTLIASTVASIDGYTQAFEDSLTIGDKKIRLGIYGILVSNNKVLMVKTVSGTKTIYNFPGGGIERGEGFHTALKRECLEELNSKVTIGNLIHTSTQLYGHDDFSPLSCSYHLYYSIEADEKTISKGSEILDIQWFDIIHLPLNEMLPIDKEVAELFLLQSGGDRGIPQKN